MIRYIWGSILILAFSCVDAQTSRELFQDQVEVFSSRHENIPYPLALSALKKVNGTWLAEREELLTGTSEKRAYEIGRRMSLDTAWRVLQNYFVDRSAELLFECVGLDCGSSNAWANEVFAVKQLYGRDVSQRYQVWQDGDKFARVYLVQRGNKRIYYLFEWFEPNTPGIKFVPAADAIAKNLYAKRWLPMQGLSFINGELILDDAYIAVYADALNQQPFRKVAIVVRVGSVAPADEVSEHRRMTQSVERALAEKGVQSRRFVSLSTYEELPQPESGAPPEAFIILVP